MEETEVSEPKKEDLLVLYRATNKAKPKPEDVKAMRDYLAKYPKQAEAIGDLAVQVEHRMLETAFSNNKAGEIATDEYMYNMRKGLGYETASPVERTLIQHVVLCWFRLYLTENRYESRMQESLSLAQGLYWEKKLSANQRRYLRAIETLARVRKMNITVQINMAHQQIVTG
jgi:hypothetical protein